MAEIIEQMEKKVNQEMKLYQDPLWLKEKYKETGSIYRMAEIAGCSYRTIHKWMVANHIEMHGMNGQKQTEESIQKRISGRKGKPIAKRKSISNEARKRMSEQRKGSGNSNWKGGITEKVRKFRRSKEYMQWRKAVLDRADNICEECGSTDNIEAHHKISLFEDFSKALNINNGQALCHKCHKKKDWRKRNDE